MTTRERNLAAVVLLIVGGVATAFVAQKYFLAPLKGYNDAIAALEEEVDQKQNKLNRIKKDQAELERWKQRSLPSTERAVSEYDNYLNEVFREAKLNLKDRTLPTRTEAKAATPGAPKKAEHIVLPFVVKAKGDLASVFKTLEILERTPLAHRVKSLSLERGSSKDPGLLDVQMTLETMIVANAKNQTAGYALYPSVEIFALNAVATLEGAPGGALFWPWLSRHRGPSDWPGEPSTISPEVLARNLFLGKVKPAAPEVAKKVEEEPPPVVDDGPDIREYIRLEQITDNGTAPEAFLRNRFFNDAPQRLKSRPMSGYDIFRIMNEDRSKVVVKGKVLRIDPRAVYFQVAEDVYGIRLDQTLSQAMRRPLNDLEMDELELTKLFDQKYAEQEMKSKKR